MSVNTIIDTMKDLMRDSQAQEFTQAEMLNGLNIVVRKIIARYRLAKPLLKTTTIALDGINNFIVAPVDFVKVERLSTASPKYYLYREVEYDQLDMCGDWQYFYAVIDKEISGVTQRIFQWRETYVPKADSLFLTYHWQPVALVAGGNLPGLLAAWDDSVAYIAADFVRGTLDENTRSTSFNAEDSLRVMIASLVNSDGTRNVVTSGAYDR